MVNGTPLADYYERVGVHWNNKDPFVLFLCNGGFVYFDYKYEICGVRAVSFDSSKDANTHLRSAFERDLFEKRPISKETYLKRDLCEKRPSLV